MTGGTQNAHTGQMDPDAPAQPLAGDSPAHGVAALKPRLRGWLHFGAAPLAFVLGLILLVITPTVGLRAAVAVYVLTTVLLFGVSAAYHLGAGSAKVNDFLHKLDHANIYLFIAGSYTPFAAALPSAGPAVDDPRARVGDRPRRPRSSASPGHLRRAGW